MSNIYILEPPALGKVLLKTTVGDIDLELWTKEAPKASRNFIQLCLEGYYTGTIFHRVVPDFIVQGGDPNGDGTGGESIYGAPFKDEFHSRLRFSRRGLVAMANAGKDDNGSQFFFTLNATPELQNKHTIFGKVTGETIYNMLKLSEGEIGPDERPDYPHKILQADVVINPFDDIVPRVTQKTEEQPKKKKKKERQGVKNFGLLSFGMEAEEDEGEAGEFRGKPKSTHDLLDDPKLSKKTAAELQLPEDIPSKSTDNDASSDKTDTNVTSEPSATVSSIREKLKKKEVEVDKSDSEEEEEEYYLGKEKHDERKKETERIKNEIKKLKKDMKPPKLVETGSEEESKPTNTKEDNELYQKYVEEQEKYTKLKEKLPKKGAARESFTLELLAKFKTKLSSIKEKSQNDDNKKEDDKIDEDDEDVNNEDWLGHTLCFEGKGPVLAKDAATKGDDWFDIYDPRNPLNKRKREESDKKQKAKLAKK